LLTKKNSPGAVSSFETSKLDGEIGMEFTELLRARHSVRRYLPKPVADELVVKILEAVRTAPSAGNFQSYEIYLVSGSERMQALAGATFMGGRGSHGTCCMYQRRAL
jgi:hypothetical protein